jgi:hypothetical protein
VVASRDDEPRGHPPELIPTVELDGEVRVCRAGGVDRGWPLVVGQCQALVEQPFHRVLRNVIHAAIPVRMLDWAGE